MENMSYLLSVASVLSGVNKKNAFISPTALLTLNRCFVTMHSVTKVGSGILCQRVH